MSSSSSWRHQKAEGGCLNRDKDASLIKLCSVKTHFNIRQQPRVVSASKAPEKTGQAAILGHPPSSAFSCGRSSRAVSASHSHLDPLLSHSDFMSSLSDVCTSSPGGGAII